MISRVICIRWLVAFFFVLLGSATASEKQSHFLLRAIEGKVTTQPTAGPSNYSNCVLVMPDGKFYLSLRRQEIMGGPISIESFQGSLDERAVQILRGILDQQTIINAPGFELPTTPFGADEFESFDAGINRGSALQRVGYFKWSGRGPENPDSTKKDWQLSETALKPLVEWSRALKTNKYPLKRPASRSRTLQCDLGDNVTNKTPQPEVDEKSAIALIDSIASEQLVSQPATVVPHANLWCAIPRVSAGDLVWPPGGATQSRGTTVA